MSITNKLKLLLSKIRVAQLNKKKKLKLKILLIDVFLLEILWKNNFIYGYNKIQLCYFVFLRYNLQGQGILDSVIFLNSHLNNKKLKRLLSLNPNENYLVLTHRGISICSAIDSVGYGGKLIAKL
jgi:ribosomal protein S8